MNFQNFYRVIYSQWILHAKSIIIIDLVETGTSPSGGYPPATDETGRKVKKMEKYKISIRMLTKKQFIGEDIEPYICETCEIVEDVNEDVALDNYMQYFFDKCVEYGYDVERMGLNSIKVVQDDIVRFYEFSAMKLKMRQGERKQKNVKIGIFCKVK